MVRNPIKKETKEEVPTPEAQDPETPEAPTQFVEREITLSLLNDKLNYITGLLHKIVEAAEIDLKE